MNYFPESGYVRLRQIIGDPKASPPVPGVIPVSRSLWWEWVKTGKAPKPHKLGPKITAWRVSDIRRLIDELAEQEAA